MPTDLTQSSDLADNRKAKGITLGAIESTTRIGLHFLEAIEAEDFSKLPGGVYTISYLRQYARASGFDESALVRRYYDKTQPRVPEDPVSPRMRLPRWLRSCEPLRAFFENLPHQESRNQA